MSNMDTPLADRLQEALRLHQEDNIDKALALYDAILEDNPQHSLTLHAKGIALAQLGDYVKSKTFLEAAVRVEPKNAVYYASLGNCQRHLGELEKALASFTKAIALQPTLAGYINIGVLHYQQAEYQLAMDAFESALAMNNDSPVALFNMALCRLQQQRISDAQTLLERVIDLDSKHEAAWSQLGKLYFAQQSFLQAKQCYTQLLKLNPHHAEAIAQMGLLELNLSQDEAGLSLLEKAYKLDTTVDDIEHNLACVYLHRRRYEDALRHWLKDLAHDPGDTHYNIGVCYLYMGRYAEATDHFNHMLSKHSDHHATLVNLGACYLQQNKRADAVGFYERAQAIKPQDEIAYLLSALQNKGDRMQAPVGYVTDLFNQYAHNYDNHLNNVLSYRVPNTIHQLVSRSLNPASKSLFCLDLGCGTGLSGELIAPFCHRLVGIDLANNMLELAKEKSVYDQLVCAKLPDACDDYRDVDLAIAGDFLPYVGDLAPIFSAVFSCLRSGGWLVFTTEKTYDNDYILQDNARFAHSFGYVSRCLDAQGFSLLAYENAQLRTHQRSYVEGLCYLVQKP